MLKPSLLDRLAQPRSLAVIFAAIMAFVAISAIPAEARRHGWRSHERHYYSYRHYVQQRAYRSDAGHSFGRTRAAAGDDGIVGEHRGFAAIVVDANSGRELYARNEHELRHPASVTKVMTLYLLFEQLEQGRLSLNSPLMISQHAAAQAPSKLGLRPGETISVENAIKAVVTKSANDIACAIAENVAGDERRFAQMMTSKAHALGMRDTHYENASGLPDARQVTTAYDLAVLGRAIQERFPRYYRYFSTHAFAYNGALHRNHNHLLDRVEGMDGIKTGYTRASGFNLLTSVRRGGHHIVAVVMGGATAGSRDNIMAGLIEEHIRGGAAARTARAVVEEPQQEEWPPEPVREERVAYAPQTEDMEPIAPPQFQRRAAEPAAQSAAPAPAHERAEKPVIRPAFVSGVRKVLDETKDAERKSARATAKGHGGATTLAVADGSTSSRASKGADVAAVSTTPSAIRAAKPPPSKLESAKAEAGRPARAGWMIQIAATEDPDKANQLLSRARSQLQGLPADAKAFTEKVQKGKETLYRARFAGLEEESAASACRALKRSGFSCFTTRN
ncbi:serine hydrolase [Methylocystis sp. 9N]|uniref:Serine hydrolase n=1 Tax=Methylocystis borbori TaxID=3118750 RepID=A0ABU7XEV8_9HYPH